MKEASPQVNPGVEGFGIGTSPGGAAHDSSEPRWPLRRWIILLSWIAAAHLVVIFAFGEKDLPPLKKHRPPSEMSIASGASDELIGLADPTLFAVPHPRTFSGLNRGEENKTQTDAFVWPDEPFSLALSPEMLATASVARTGIDASGTLAVAEPPPVFSQPALPSPLPLPTESVIRVEGELKQRKMLKTLTAPVREANDLLPSTVVGLAVNTAGDPVSVTLLASSGAPEADQLALKTANQAQFQSIDMSGPDRAGAAVTNLTWGRMIFQWQTVPVATTNKPASTKPGMAR
jgi:hypothetical protein